MMEFIQKLREALHFTRLLLGVFFDFILYKLKTVEIQRSEDDISGKCVVVTGASRGIGKSSAKEFAQRGAIVVIGVRNMEVGQSIADEIYKETGKMNVRVLNLDLSDMDSVELFARQVSTDYPKIKVLLNNAGIGASKSENVKTKDGFNMHLAVNYLGHFLLTNLLMDNLKAETDSRIVFVTSTFALMSELDIDDLNMDKSRFGLQNLIPYSNTKCMEALFTKQLGKENGVRSYAVCPGIVDTAIYNDIPLLGRLVFRTSMLFSISPKEAASNIVMRYALDKSLQNESGETYRFRRHFHAVKEKLENYSESHLFETSARLVKLKERIERKNLLK